MLVLKKISVKKLAIYLAIIFFMIGGIGFMLLQNKNSAPDQPANVSQLLVTNNSAPDVSAVKVNTMAGVGSGQTLDINKNYQSVGDLNLNIFSSDKFKNLLANVFIFRDGSEVGKRDPFKPN